MFKGKDIGVELAHLFGSRQEAGTVDPPIDDGLMGGWGPTAGGGGGAASPYAGMFDSPVVQRVASGGGAPGLGAAELVPAGGRPLDASVQRMMERALGADFSGVRVHTDDGRARAMGAEAYTVGSDIVFRNGNYDPDRADGQRRLAHELTHVQQQRAGAVEGTDIGDGVAVSDPGDAFERAAEASADAVMGGAAPVAAAPAGGASGQGVVQREEEKGFGDKAWDFAKKKAKDLVPDKLKNIVAPVGEAVRGGYNVFSQPAGSVERRDAAREALENTAEASGKALGSLIPGKFGDKVGGKVGKWLGKQAHEAFPEKPDVKLDEANAEVNGQKDVGSAEIANSNGDVKANETQNVNDRGDIIDSRTGEVQNTPGTQTISDEELKRKIDEEKERAKNNPDPAPEPPAQDAGGGE
jgi:hypothetical protein